MAFWVKLSNPKDSAVFTPPVLIMPSKVLKNMAYLKDFCFLLKESFVVTRFLPAAMIQ